MDLLASVIIIVVFLFTKSPVIAQSTCSTSLQSLINEAASGATIQVPPCIYRESVTVTKPITIDGGGKAEIRGSDIWTGWQKNGIYWEKGTVPSFKQNDHSCDSREIPDTRMSGECNWQEQVFYDGRELNQVSSNPKTGEFLVTTDRKIQLADNPDGHTVEVTVREKWLTAGTDNVTVKGMIMKHAANSAQTGAITINSRKGWVLEHNIFQYAHGGNISIDNANVIVRNNEISYAGHLGIHAPHANGLIIDGNSIHHNNEQHVSCGFECGGMKATASTGLTIINNDVFKNYGYGLWCDIGCNNVDYSNNRVHDNDYKGIAHEISGTAKIHDNKVWNNGFMYSLWGWGAGILVQNSSGVEVFNNVIAWNADGVGTIQQDRGNSTAVTNNYIHNNTIISDTGYALFWLSDNGGSMFSSTSNNRGANNIYFITTADGSRAFYSWNGDIKKISDFNNTPGEEKGIYMTSVEKDTILTQSHIPTKPGVYVEPSVTPTINPTVSPTLIPTAKPTTNTPIPSTTAGCSLKIKGDADCNGQINLVDFEAWRREFTTGTGSLSDFNGDHLVNLADFEIWRTNGL